jgi:hypothetical protein
LPSRRTRERADRVVDLLDLQGMTRILDEWHPSAVTFAGAVGRPRASAILNGLSALRNRRELAGLMAKGDDGLLRSAVGFFEERGYVVVGAHELAPELLAAPGLLTRAAPGPHETRALEIGFATLEDLAVRDMGQACVGHRRAASSPSKVPRAPTACLPVCAPSAAPGVASASRPGAFWSRPRSGGRTCGSILPRSARAPSSTRVGPGFPGSLSAAGRR